VDGTRIRLLGALAGAVLVMPLLSGCGAIDGLFTQTPAAPDIFEIVVGDCLDDDDVSGQVTSVPIVDCSEPHDSEVFARTVLTGTAFPGDEELEAQLTEFCQGEVYTDFLGRPYADSAYYTGGYYPTAASWASGDRELLCTVRDDGSPTTGSLEGAERPEPTPTPTP
jgi:hypothetical protein